MNTTTWLKAGTTMGLAAAAGLLGTHLAPQAATATSPPSPPASYTLTGIIRDFSPYFVGTLHPDFEASPSSSSGGGRSCGNVQTTLDADGKPVYVGGGRRVSKEWRDAQSREISWCVPAMPSDTAGKWGTDSSGAVTSASTFAQWYRDTPGTNMSRQWSITMTRQEDGVYTYETNDFNPIDSQLFGNGLDEHNFFFTYEVPCEFTYDASAGQFLSFKGDDDCWVFVDGKLALDHGGIAGSPFLHVDLNRFGLTSGQKYTLKFFHAERKQPQSQFHLKTNIVLQAAMAALPTVTDAFD